MRTPQVDWTPRAEVEVGRTYVNPVDGSPAGTVVEVHDDKVVVDHDPGGWANHHDRRIPLQPEDD